MQWWCELMEAQSQGIEHACICNHIVCCQRCSVQIEANDEEKGAVDLLRPVAVLLDWPRALKSP
jgi:hypothetical protein